MIRMGIIGFGKIAADQHVPAMAGNASYRFCAAASRTPLTLDGIATYTDYNLMLTEAEIEAVAVCTPASVRYAIARDCLEAGKHVMLEKPPGVTLGEVEALAKLAEDRKVTLMTTWHAQANPAVAAADALAGQRIASLQITWHENVRKWHPGQAWIWEAGGFGVFDPGINALSIATRIVPAELIVQSAKLFVPANKQMPIAADLVLTSVAATGEMPVSFDFRSVEGEIWTIEVRTESGVHLLLSQGGSKLAIDGVEQAVEGEGEYPALYTQFAALVADGRSDVNVRPLRIVADAFMMAEREIVEAFED